MLASSFLAHVATSLPWLRALRPTRLLVVLAGVLLTAGLGATGASAATLVVDGPPHGDVLDPIVLTPGGQRIVFLADLERDHKVELFSAPSFGGGPVRVTPAMPDDRDVNAFALTPDGQSVVYLADQRVDNRIELFRAPVGGGSFAQLSAPMPEGGNVLRFGITPDGSRAVYLADGHVDNSYELYSVRLAGGAVTRLTPDLPPWADVSFDFDLTLDSRRAILRADLADDKVYDLLSVRLDGSEEPLRLNPDVLSEKGVEPDLVVNPTRSVVSFRMEVEPGVHHRWAVPVDGSADPALVHGDLPDGASGATRVAALSRDGNGIVHVADAETPGTHELWLAPANGTAPARKISGTAFAEGGRVRQVALTPDDLTVVYLADGRSVDVHELFAAPLDVVASPRRVSRSLATGGDVLPGFVVTGGATTRVVYRADARTAGQVELWSAGLEDRARSTQLNPDLPAEGDVRASDDDVLAAFKVSFDGSEVLFLADVVTDDDLDLHTVPTDGSGPAVALSDHVAGRSVEDLTELVASRVAYVSVDSSTSSDEDVYVTPVRSPPAPTDPRAVFGPDGVTVSWDAPLTDVPVGGYVITATPGGLVTLVDGDTTSVTVDGLDPGVTYVFTVEATNDLGNSPGVDTDELTTPAGPPDPVAAMSAEAGPTSVLVRWTPAPAGEAVDTYTLWTTPGDATVDVPASVTEVVVNGLDPDTPYTFLLAARNLAGISRTGSFGPVRPLRADGSVVTEPAIGDATFTVLTEGSRDALTTGEVDRVAGESRYATAAALSRVGHPSGSDVVYLAVGTNFPDALAAGPVAGAADAPILLVAPTRLPAETVAELQRLRPRDVRVLGGSGAIADNVTAALSALVPDATITRIAGESRYETAALLSASAFGTGVDTVHLATGRNFPDALGAGAVAGAAGAPILLTDPDRLPLTTAEELLRLAPRRVVVLGGLHAVSEEVVATVASLGIVVERVAGADRYTTGARLVAANFPPGVGQVFLAVGTNFPDALAAGPLAGRLGAPILLTARTSLPAATRAELLRLAPARVTILGGPAAVSVDVLTAVADLVAAPATAQ